MKAQIMEPKVIELKKYRGNNSYTYTGRPEGEAARKDLQLDIEDKDQDRVLIKIPKGTTSINPSFFLGLFYDSIKRLGGVKPFQEKYQFSFEDEDEEIRIILLDNIADALRYANNFINKKSSIFSFLK